ncbi:hypothetical protein ACOMHN_007817 [Nucella lapillus]
MAQEQAELPTDDRKMEEEKETSEKEDESDEEESDDEEYFEVEKIMSRKKRDGVFLYRVRWKGYPPSNDTWEPVDNLDVVKDMVEEFDAKEEQKTKARQEERHLRKLRMEGKKLPGEESSDSSSSDDERLLSEDTKFFKMLEKNKNIVFGQPDLYSKVKSRAATLASKKKTEENHESSAAPSKTAQGQTEGVRARGRGRRTEEALPVKSRTQSKRGKKAIHKDSEDEWDDSPLRGKAAARGRGRDEWDDSPLRGKAAARGRGRDESDDSPLRGKAAARGRGRDESDDSPLRGKATARGRGRDESDDSTLRGKAAARGRGRPKRQVSSEEDVDSDDSVSAGKGRRRGRPKKKESSEEEEEDSDDSTVVGKSRGQGKTGKKPMIEDSEKESDSDDFVPLRSRGRQKKTFRIESSEENASDSSLIQKKQSRSVQLSDRKQTAKKPPHAKKTTTQRRPSPISEKESEKSSSDSEEEKQTSPRSDKASVTSEKPGRTSPIIGQNRTTNSSEPASESCRDKPSPVTSPVQPRLIVPVLEKFALSAQLVRMKEERAESPRDEKSPSSGSNKASHEEKSTTAERGSTKAESMEIETPQRKEEWKESKKKSGSSRKRKQDTAAEHAKAVTEGEASPPKTSPPRPHSPSEEQPMVIDTEPPVLSKEPRASELPGGCVETATHIMPPVLQKSAQERKVPPLRITVPKLRIDTSKSKPESPKPYYHHHSPKSQSSSGKSEKVKLKDSVKSGKHDQHIAGSVPKTPHTSKRPPSRESVPEAAPTVTASSGSSVTCGTSAPATRKDMTSKAVTSAASLHQSSSTKPDLSLKFGRTLAMESASLKLEILSSRTPKPEVVDRTGRTDHPDQKAGRTDSVDSRRKSCSDFTPSNVTSNRDPLCGPYTASSVKDLPSPSRDLLLSPTSRSISSVFTSASTSRETSSLYTSIRDSSIVARGVGVTSVSGRDLSHTPSLGLGRDGHLHSGPSRDFSSGSPGDVRLGAGYIHLNSGSSRESSFASSRDAHSLRGEPKDGCAGGSRHSLLSSSIISGKENADRQLGFKSLSSLPKKGDPIQPLDTILNSSLYDGDKSRQYKGLDSDFDLALQRIDLEYLEKLLLPPVSPMELSDEELRQAVIDGNCYLVERALACTKPYNLDLPDNKGYTLLMNAVLRGSDDIIVHLLSRGADAQVQVNGVTALMLSVEHAESSTVFMLLEMGSHVNAADVNGETALFKAVRRGDKQILKLLLDHGANFSLISRLGLNPLQMAKQFRLADVETTLIDHVHKVVRSFEEQVNLTVRGTAKLVSCLFPHHCVPLYESEVITIPFKYQPSMPTGPGMGCLLFIAHARFNPQDVKCRLYGQCAVERVTLNGVLQPCLTEESNFVLMCHPLITGWNELVISMKKDAMSKAKLIICAYKAQLIFK